MKGLVDLLGRISRPVLHAMQLAVILLMGVCCYATCAKATFAASRPDHVQTGVTSDATPDRGFRPRLLAIAPSAFRVPMQSLILAAAFVACIFSTPLVSEAGCPGGFCPANAVNVNVGRSFSRGAVNVNVGRGFGPSVQQQTFGPRGRLRSQTIVREPPWSTTPPKS